MPVASSADLSQLGNFVSAEYGPERVVEKLKNEISAAVKAILIEHNYVDKDYRSTYYSFYAKKGQHYRSHCVRLHFFDEAVTLVTATLKLHSAYDKPTDHYFGFMVLRPTGLKTIGRTVLSPDIRKGASRSIIAADHKAHLLGEKLSVRGFPSMDQHQDISVCAHVACWSILRHYSERYSIYREFLTHDITMMAEEFDPGGLVPAKGLGMSHATRVFQIAGTFPEHVVKVAQPGGAPDKAFYRQLIAYLESGFPLFAALEDHAVAVVGYEWKATSAVAPPPGLRFAIDEVQNLSVVDDNCLPYLSIPISGGTDYSADDFEEFIVPLPEKVHYSADAVEEYTPSLFTLGAVIGLPPEDETIVRYFITTASAFRHFVREHESEYHPKLLQAIMTLPFAQFIWIVEFTTKAEWDKRNVLACAVMDATAALSERSPLWLFYNRTNALVFERRVVPNDDVRALTMPPGGRIGFSRMDQPNVMRSTHTR
jgi:hypothetical protein